MQIPLGFGDLTGAPSNQENSVANDPCLIEDSLTQGFKVKTNLLHPSPKGLK